MFPEQDKQSPQEKFDVKFDSTSSEDWGSAGLTSADWQALRKLHKGVNFKGIKGEERRQIKAEARQRIIDEGWPVLDGEDITPERVAEAAGKHACCVGKWIYENRILGQKTEQDIEVAARKTEWSYLVKNSEYRDLLNRLRKNPNFFKSSSLWNEWYGKQDREHGYIPPKDKIEVEYPQTIGEEDRNICGIAKPNIYFPVQLLRNLEEIRTGRTLLDSETDPETFKIERSNFDDVIENAETVDGIAVGIAVRTMEILKKRGVSDEQITNIILSGYNPVGPVIEHGNISEVGQLWDQIIQATGENEKTAKLQGMLQSKLEARYEKIKYRRS